MKYVDILAEDGTNGTYHQVTSLDEFFEYYAGGYKTAFELAKNGRFIYRGINDASKTEVNLFDPRVSERKSTSGSQLYALLFDNLKCWKDYPKRSRSVILHN